jgi:TolB-like protein
MSNLIPTSTPFIFSDDAIYYQLNRIFQHPDFYKSEILKKFLHFIVSQTLIGNANSLKEYTIAVQVLDKPVNFNPQKNCIVRIHAGRLRLALSHYYLTRHKDDDIIIGIPKGKYVPVFMDQQQWLSRMKLNKKVIRTEGNPAHKTPVTFSILPFVCTGDDDLLNAFADSLCLQLCSSLSQVKEISVLAYQAVKGLSEKYIDLKEFGDLVGFNHIITGGIHTIKGKLRITIQIIECRTYRVIWSEVFECKASSNLFDVQDTICRRATREVKNLTPVNPVSFNVM